MDKIAIRYGEDLTLPINAGSTSYVTAEIYIGKPGEVYTLTKSSALTDGEGVFNFTGAETSIPLGVYNYQINLITSDDKVVKLPSPDCDDCGFPEFVVCESLDETEVS